MSERLERDYRRLLACYPPAYRREYGEEMVGVLMEQAGDGQRHPSLPDIVDLLKGGIATRLRLTWRTRPDGSWRDAISAFGLLLALTLLTITVRSIVYGLATHAITLATLPDIWLIRSIGWTAVLILLGLGLRTIAATAAALTVATETVLQVLNPLDAVIPELYAARALLLGLVAAIALGVPNPRRRVFTIFGRAGSVAVLLGAATVALIQLIEFIWWPPVYGTDFLLAPGITIGQQRFSYLLLPFYLAVLLAISWMLARLNRPVLRRLVVLAVPLVIVHSMIDRLFNGFVFGQPIYLASPEEVSAYLAWMALLPLLAFGLGMGLLHWHERRMTRGAASATEPPTDPGQTPPTP